MEIAAASLAELIASSLYSNVLYSYDIFACHLSQDAFTAGEHMQRDLFVPPTGFTLVKTL